MSVVRRTAACHVWLVLGVLALLAQRPALAKPPAGEPVSAPVNVLIQRGEAALLAQDLATAERALTTAYRQDPRADLLYSLGRLAAAQQQLLSAQDLLRRYLNDPTITADPVKAAEAQKLLAQPRPPSGKVRIQGDRGGLVSLDGRLLGRLPLVQPLLAAPGVRTVTIQYPGKSLEVPIEVAVGRMIDIRCTRATGAIFLSTLPALLILPDLAALPPATAELLFDAVERAAQGEQLSLVKPDMLLTIAPELHKELPSKTATDLPQCLAELDCLYKLLDKTKLDHALRVRARLTAQGSAEPQWELGVELLRKSIYGAASVQSQTCAPCTEQKAATALQDAVSKTLATGLKRPHGTLTVTSEPGGAEVRWGDQVLGRTPLSLQAWTGEYALELRQPGHEPSQLTAHVELDKTAELAVTMTPLPAVPPPPVSTKAEPPPQTVVRWQRAPRPRWRIAVGITSMAVGLVPLIAGAANLQPSSPIPCVQSLPNDPLLAPLHPLCTPSINEYNMGTGTIPTAGAALVAVGSAVVVGGAILLAWPGPRRAVRTLKSP